MGPKAQPAIIALNAARRIAKRIVTGLRHESAAFSQRLTEPSRHSQDRTPIRFPFSTLNAQTTAREAVVHSFPPALAFRN